jgi:hypothetical protein
MKFIMIPEDQSNFEKKSIVSSSLKELGMYFYNYSEKDNLYHFKVSSETYLNVLKEIYRDYKVYWENDEDNHMMIVEISLDELIKINNTESTLLVLQS